MRLIHMLFVLVLFASIAFATSCVSNYECEAHQECVDGQCVAKPVPCTHKSDCPLHQDCIGGWCDLSEVYCQETANCEYWQVCTDNKCVLASGYCNENSDCAVTRQCDAENHRCGTAPLKSCLSSVDCDEWEYCAALSPNQCLLKQGMCTEASDCKEGEECKNHACIYPITGPAAAGEAAEGELQIQYENATPCQTNADCASFEQCSLTEGICILGDGGCYSNANCGEWQTCTDNQCVSNPGMCSDQEECNAENEICDEYHKCIPKPAEEPAPEPAPPATPSEPAAPIEPEPEPAPAEAAPPVSTTTEEILSPMHVLIFIIFVVLVIVVVSFLRGDQKSRAKAEEAEEEALYPGDVTKKPKPKKKTAKKKKKRKTKKK